MNKYSSIAVVVDVQRISAFQLIKGTNIESENTNILYRIMVWFENWKIFYETFFSNNL